jgi:hypothetical protein
LPPIIDDAISSLAQRLTRDSSDAQRAKKELDISPSFSAAPRRARRRVFQHFAIIFAAAAITPVTPLLTLMPFRAIAIIDY